MQCSPPAEHKYRNSHRFGCAPVKRSDIFSPIHLTEFLTKFRVRRRLPSQCYPQNLGVDYSALADEPVPRRGACESTVPWMRAVSVTPTPFLLFSASSRYGCLAPEESVAACYRSAHEKGSSLVLTHHSLSLLLCWSPLTLLTFTGALIHP